MDVCESEKHPPLDRVRLPSVPVERNNNASTATRRPRTREISSRYKSPTPSAVSRRSPSPCITRLLPTTSSVQKRAQSAERRRPSTPPSPSSPATPVKDSSIKMPLYARRLSTSGRSQEGLWPSTMRSLSVSFQSDAISIPVSKKEKPVSSASSDRTLRPSSNVAHKQVESPTGSRKPMPERKRSPLKGKNAQDQSENTKPVDGLRTRLIDQHRWPSKIGGKLSPNPMNKSIDFADKSVRALTSPHGIGLSSLRRTPTLDGVKPLQKSASDAAQLLSLEDIGRKGIEVNSLDDSLLRVFGAHKVISASSSEKTSLTTVGVDSKTTAGVKSQSLPSPRLCPASPSRTSISRGVSPVRSRPSTPPSRGVSPSRIRPSGVSSQSNGSTSVLSFIADFKKGKKGTNYIEDAHQIRLLHNRYLQWRFANAQAEAVLHTQKVIAEKTLYNVWNTTLTLWDSIIRKRINLQQLQLELKLNVVLSDQMPYLNDWALLEKDHINSLSRAVEDLEASTLRVPVAGGAKADIESLKVAICSAVDVMQAMGSSLCSLLSKVEKMNCLTFELAVVAAQEKAMLDDCEALLASIVAMQVEEYSLRTHLMQVKEVLEKQSISTMRMHAWL